MRRKRLNSFGTHTRWGVETLADILTPEVLECIHKYANAGAVNIKFSNLAQSFLDVHYTQR